IVIGLLTGIVPALLLPRFQPARLFRPQVQAGGITLRKVLVVSQFSVSILLTVCTVVTYKQVSFMQQALLGYTTDHTLVLDVGLPGIREKLSALKSELSRIPGVLGSTAVSQLPTDIQTGENIDISATETHGVYCVSVDQDFFKVMGIPLHEGTKRVEALVPT